jgi:hypothetical protein
LFQTDYIYIENAVIDIETTKGASLYNSDPAKAGYYVNAEGAEGWNGDGIASTGNMWIKSGAITVKTADGPVGAKYEKADFVTVSGGAEKESADPSLKGIKADRSLLVESGYITLNTRDDGINAGGETGVTPYDPETSLAGRTFITGGTITINCDQDGIKGEAGVLISGGSIRITHAVEGIEGAKVLVTGGTITSATDDEVINASGGPTGTVSPGHFVIVSGGVIDAFSPNDVIDANGSLLISDGSLFLRHQGVKDHEPIDTEYGWTITGGVLFAASDGDMQLPAKNSSQPSIALYWAGHPKSAPSAQGSNRPASTPVRLVDSSNQTLASWTPDRAFNKVIISTPHLARNSWCMVSAGGEGVKFLLSQITNPVVLH